MFTVYVLRSDTNHRLYIGQTNNLSRRLLDHNSGYSTYTKFTKPFKLIYQENFPTRKEAVNREIELKSGKGREWLKMILESC
jgi:putative endonuclease